MPKRKGCQRFDSTPIFLDPLEPFHQTENWFIELAHQPDGFKCMWGAMGIPMITNGHQQKIMIEKRAEPFLRISLHLDQDFIDKYFIFKEGMISKYHQKEAKKIFIENIRFSPNSILKEHRKEYFKVLNHIDMQCKKAIGYQHRMKWPGMAIIHARNAWTKSKELEISFVIFEYQTMALHIMGTNQFHLKYFYGFTKTIIKLMNLNQLMLQHLSLRKEEANKIIFLLDKNKSFINEMYEINFTSILREHHLQLFIKSKKISYNYKEFQFHCNTYRLLKHRMGITLKQWLYEHRIKACAYEKCKMLYVSKSTKKTWTWSRTTKAYTSQYKENETQNKKRPNKFKRYKCSRCKKKYYCNKSCQKKDWRLRHRFNCY